jgi:hypothetical protein
MRKTLLGFALAAALVAPAARADHVAGTRSEKLTERTHLVLVRLAPERATLVVTRVLDNQGPRHDQALVDIDLPEGAVATRLRTLGFVGGEKRWFEADLMEAEQAAARYRELTGIGGYYPKDPALLSWRTQSHLLLQVFPVAPRADKTVEYTLEMPTSYEEGRSVLHLSRMGTEARAATVVAWPADLRDQVLVEGKPVAAGARVAFGEKGQIDLVLERHAQERLAGDLAVVPFGPKRVLHHARVEAARRLSRAPRGASVVLVLDASRSLGDEDRKAEVAAARAYLGHMPEANVEIVTFDRAPHRRFGRLVPVSSALADLERTPIAAKNGSHVDLALEEAARLLEASPPGARRAILLTDFATRDALDPGRLRGVFAKSGAVVHLASVSPGAPQLARDDDDVWAKVARSTGGVLWRASATDGAHDALEMRRVYEEWARPLRIDRVSLSGLPFAPPDRIDEGQAVEIAEIDEVGARAVVVSGELWSSPLRVALQPDAAYARAWSAMVFGSNLLYELTEREMMTLAKAGHAVSPVTSLLAIEPGVRPSTEGLEGEGEGGGGMGHGIGLGSIGTLGHGAHVRTFDPVAFLRERLAREWRRCDPSATRTATVRVETTIAEVVDIPNVSVKPAAPSGAGECLREAAWALDLPAGFDAAHATYDVAL